jgi:hypothetical protein
VKLSASWRLRLVVYGLLAACALGVFAAMPRAEQQPERVVLEGRTARGDHIELVLYDGRLHSLSAKSVVHCPKPWRYWQRWDWHPIDGLPGMRFRQEGGRFHAVTRWSTRAASRPAST